MEKAMIPDTTMRISGTVLALAVLAISGPAYGSEYVVTDLGTLGGVSSGAAVIRGEGQIVGASTLYSGVQHAYLWQDGAMTDLGAPEGYVVSSAASVNDAGQVVASTFGEYQSQYAYIWDSGTWAYLGTLPGPGLDWSAATDINNAGQIAGYSFTLGPGSAHRAWILDGGQMTDLGTLGGDQASAGAVNEAGQVVGWAQTGDPDFVTHAFLWDGGIMTDLGTLPGDTGSSAADLNENGQVCGSSTAPVPPYFTARTACLWDNGQVIDLGSLPGYAKSGAAGINDQGEVVGFLGISLSGGSSAAFIWKDGVMTDLNTLIDPNSGWVLLSASDINNAGRIVGWGAAPNGEYHGFLLTPTCTADLNGDGQVDIADLGQMLPNYGITGGATYEDGDLNGDGNVDISDLGALLAAYGSSC
jgi:probable HAF family extracellular repeat protein